MQDINPLLQTMENEAVKKYERIKAGVQIRTIISNRIKELRKLKTPKKVKAPVTEEPKKEPTPGV